MAVTNPNRTVRIKDLSRFKSNMDGLYLFTHVNINTLTPSSTFVKNSIIGINGVLYRSTKATSNFPVTLQVSGSSFVTNTINGKIAFVVTDATLNSDWVIFTDASIEYWLDQLSTRITALENLSVTHDGITYTLGQLMTAMAQLMSKTVVIK